MVETAMRPHNTTGSMINEVHSASSPTTGRDYQKNISEPAFFPPLTANDEFDIFDIELRVNAGGKAEITVRSRHVSNARPIYKAEKTIKLHLLTQKKNLNIVISRNEAWDSAKAGALKRGRGFKYRPIWEGWDLNPRSLSVTATQFMALSGTSRGGTFTMSHSCGSYDPLKVRNSRDCFSHHFFPIHMANFELARSNRSGQRHRTPPQPLVNPDALEKPYAGGGYFVFDCHSQGRKELLTTLYCTGYEQRHRVRNGDIVVAELRLPVLSTDGKKEIPAWGRFLKERHAELYISRRGGEAVFYGNHVGMAVPNPQEGNRYSLSSGQAQEIVISTVSMMLFSIDNERGDKKWEWMLDRSLLEHKNGAGSGLPMDLEKAPIVDFPTSANEMGPASLKGINTLGDHWTQHSYIPSARGDAMSIPPTDSPVSETTEDGPSTPAGKRRHRCQGFDHDLPSSQVYPSSAEDGHRTEGSDYVEERKERYSEVPADVPNMIVHQLPPPGQLTKHFPHPPLVFSTPHPATSIYQTYSYPAPGELHQPPRDSLHLHRVQPPKKDVQDHPLAQSSGIPNPGQHSSPPMGMRAVPLPVPVHPASLTSWAEDNRSEPEWSSPADASAPRKEGPKVTGRPKPGEEGGIFW